ncbi:hypothetical protein [Phytomonospora endophytica]|uniref:Uncharacterized protein n=1 Tax=Phytomonospora endophytica TaxID=714109 RepID=A0A841FSG7_9ACTN|nr:hypothetical protein [Phytomonospora endophytica]MBB6035479.1 hypothetical protein [Phytomonospora endophytica]GIG63768.1 hypothetical protein Pen01_00630 [Phytomonospora endophytica]
MKNPDDKAASQESTFRGAAKKAAPDTVKAWITGIGAAVATLGGTMVGLSTKNPTLGTATTLGLSATVGAAVGHVGGAVGKMMESRREAKDATAASGSSGGGGGAGGTTIGAVKSVVFAAATAAKDGSSRITGMKSEVEGILAMLRDALDGTSSDDVRDAIGYLEEAAGKFEAASGNATGAASKASAWAAGL